MKKAVISLFEGMLALFMIFLLEFSGLIAFSNEVYAYEKNDDIPYLKDIYLSEGKNIDFKEDEYEYIVDVDEDDDEIYIKATPESDDYIVEIDDTVLNEDEKYKYETNLIEGKNKFVIKVTNEENNIVTKYELYVYRGGETAVYLKDLRVNQNKIGYEKTIDSYNIDLDENTEKVKLNITPEDDTYTVFVNDTEIDYEEYVQINFKQTVGKYNIKVTVKDNETGRSKDYNLSFYIGIDISPNAEQEIKLKRKVNQWVIVNGRWRYNNALGENLKEQWIYDKYYGGWYYLNSRGNMETEWLYLGDDTYYLGEDGARKTGWQLIDDHWYYFSADGKMVYGWVKVGDKWYYLNDDGELVTGWITLNEENYFLDKDGSMCTGWYMYNSEWYYFNIESGTMKSGEWLKYNGKWYYINNNGTMRTGWLYKNDKYYYLEMDGRMRTRPILLDGYLYYFNSDGSAKIN